METHKYMVYNSHNLVFSFKCFTSLTLPLTLPLQPGLQSVGCSHSVRANVQSVLSLLKQHQPHLCNSRVLSNGANSYDTGSCGHSDSESSSSNACGEDLSELLQTLQEELRLMSLWVHPSKVCKKASSFWKVFYYVSTLLLCVCCREQDELMRQLEDSVSKQERRELQKEQERLLMKMERKGEQIRKLRKHKAQVSCHTPAHM